MSIRVCVQGRIVEPTQATISVFNRGFLFGESVFETVTTVRGEPFALREHLERLARSAEQLGLPLPSPQHIEDAVRRTLAAAQNPESRVRIVLTQATPGQDEGRFELAPAAVGTPELIVIVQPLYAPSPAEYEAGVAAEIVSLMRNHPGAVDPSIKSGNYLNSVLALREARKRNPDAHEAILCSPAGHIAEGATSNVFLVRDGTVLTPSLAVGILEGVTRSKVLALAREAGLPCVEGYVMPEALRTADEAFITSAARGVLPLVRVDGVVLGDGRPGPVTRRLRALYDEMLARAP